MIFKEDYQTHFEVQALIDFDPTLIQQLKKNEVIRVRKYGKLLMKDRYEYNPNKVNYRFKVFIVVTPPYLGLDGIWRVGLKEI